MPSSLGEQISRWMPPEERSRRIAEARLGIAMIEARHDSGARSPAIQKVINKLNEEIRGLTNV